MLAEDLTSTSDWQTTVCTNAIDDIPTAGVCPYNNSSSNNSDSNDNEDTNDSSYFSDSNSGDDNDNTIDNTTNTDNDIIDVDGEGEDTIEELQPIWLQNNIIRTEEDDPDGTGGRE